MSDKIKFKFPENRSSGNNYFTTLEEKIELSEDDELLINREGITRKIKAKAFKGERGEKGEIGEKGETGKTGPQGEKGEKGDPFRYSDFTLEQIENLKVKGDKGEPGEKGDPGKNFEYSDFTEEQLEALRGPEGRPGRDGTGAGDMLSTNNLSDLGNIVVARKNLEVFSKYETGKKIENELVKENFAKKVGGNEFVGEQKINGFFRIGNGLSFGQGGHNILGFGIAENTSENSGVVNSEKIPFEMRHTSEAMIFNIENNLKAIGEYYELWNKNSFVIKKGGNVGIGKGNPEAKLDIDGDLKTIGTLIKRGPSADVLNIQTFNNQHGFTIGQSINGNLFIYSMRSGNEVFQIFPNGNIRFNIPSSPAGLSSGDIYWEGHTLKKVP